MAYLNTEAIEAHRRKTFRLLPGQRLATPEQAVDFVNERGFIYFWPITGITLPSLWAAVAGDRPVADAHDDPGHVTWGWKDGSLGKRRWYYAKVLRKKATLISLEAAPNFYALTENYGAPEEDYLTQYEQGRMTQEAKTVYEALLDNGPLDTIALRKAAHMTSGESDSRFNRALVDLQADFKIVPVGIARAGGWNYAFIYEVAARHFPEIEQQAHAIAEEEARQRLCRWYFESVGAARVGDVMKLFGWRLPAAERAVAALAKEGLVRGGLEVDSHTEGWGKGEWAALSSLC